MLTKQFCDWGSKKAEITIFEESPSFFIADFEFGNADDLP